MYIDAFKRFKGDDGKFMDSLTKDAKGMLSLYEAAHLRTTRDYIMDEALSFATKHMESLAGRSSPHLSRLIQNALGLSQHWNMEILVAMEYISFYEQEEDHDETVLKFSKLNFKLLQLIYLKELKMVTKYIISSATSIYIWFEIEPLNNKPMFSSFITFIYMCVSLSDCKMVQGARLCI